MRGVECLEILYGRLHCKGGQMPSWARDGIKWKLCRTEPAPEIHKKPRCAEALGSFVKCVFGIGDVCTSAVGTWCEGARSRVHVSRESAPPKLRGFSRPALQTARLPSRSLRHDSLMPKYTLCAIHKVQHDDTAARCRCVTYPGLDDYAGVNLTATLAQRDVCQEHRTGLQCLALAAQ